MTYYIQVLKNATSVKLQIPIYDSTASYDKPLTGLTYSSSGLKAAYFRDGDTAPAAITLAAGTLGTFTNNGGTAGAGGGFVTCESSNSNGFGHVYEFSMPDAVWTQGGKVLIVLFGATNMVPVLIEVQMMGNDPGSATFSSGANTAIASAVLAASIESGVSVDQMLEAIGAACAGNYDGTTGTFRAVGNAGTVRLTAVESGGNRTVTPSL